MPMNSAIVHSMISVRQLRRVLITPPPSSPRERVRSTDHAGDGSGLLPLPHDMAQPTEELSIGGYRNLYPPADLGWAARTLVIESEGAVDEESLWSTTSAPTSTSRSRPSA